MERQGGCACGAIRFRLTQDLLGTGACHCTDCQKLSGGGPNYVVLVAKGALEVTQGSPALYEAPGDSGGIVSRAFCATCGTPLWSTTDHRPFMPVKTGALDRTDDLGPQMHIYVGSAPAWHPVPHDRPTFAQMPPPDALDG